MYFMSLKKQCFTKKTCDGNLDNGLYKNNNWVDFPFPDKIRLRY